MKNIIKLLFVFIAAGALFVSCDKITYFEENSHTPNANEESYLVFLNGSMIYQVEKDAVGDDTVKIKLQVWGPLSPVATSVDINVNSASTAVSGTHYTIPSTSVTIPANTGGATFDVIMHTDNFAMGDTVLLVMNMTTADFSTVLAASTANLKLSKKPNCPWDIKTVTGDYIANERGYGEYNVSFKADPELPYRIWQSNFWDWTDDWLAFDLDPETGIVTVPPQHILMGGTYDYLVSGSGTFDICTGDMVVDFYDDVDGTHEEYTKGSVEKSAIVVKKGN